MRNWLNKGRGDHRLANQARTLRSGRHRRHGRRASLGHPAFDLRAGRPPPLLYLLVTAGALARVAAPLWIAQFIELMRSSALL